MTISPLATARLCCIGLWVYCIALAVAGLVAIVVMVVGRLLVAFGDMWHDEAKVAEDRLNEAKARVDALEAER